MQYYPNQHPYGTVPTYPYGAEGKLDHSPWGPAPRKKVDVASLAIALFAPWALFVAMLNVMSFSIHYRQPMVIYAVAGIGLLFVLFFGLHAWSSHRSAAAPFEHQREPSWHVLMFVTSFIAWSAGLYFGDANFAHNMQPFYDLTHLNNYQAVDPATIEGQQLMDAGQVEFTEGSRLDVERSMGFKDVDTYCVAPVVSPEGRSSYDFWAVGLNCCAGGSNHFHDFHCGEYANKKAHAGLRTARDDLRPFFRLAVQQAEAAFKIQAKHPIFLYWMEEPKAEVNAYRENGFKTFALGAFTHFSVQLFFVIVYLVGVVRMDL